MAFRVFDGQVQVRYVSGSSLSTTAPSAASINSGTDLTSFVTKDGIRVNSTSNRVDAATIAEVFDAQLMGSTGADLELVFKVNDVSASDTPFTTLGTYGVRGFIVYCPFNEPGNTLAAGDQVLVFPIQTGAPAFPNSARNEQQTWTCPMAVTSAPGYRVPCAA